MVVATGPGSLVLNTPLLQVAILKIIRSCVNIHQISDYR